MANASLDFRNIAKCGWDTHPTLRRGSRPSIQSPRLRLVDRPTSCRLVLLQVPAEVDGSERIAFVALRLVVSTAPRRSASVNDSIGRLSVAAGCRRGTTSRPRVFSSIFEVLDLAFAGQLEQRSLPLSNVLAGHRPFQQLQRGLVGVLAAARCLQSGPCGVPTPCPWRMSCGCWRPMRTSEFDHSWCTRSPGTRPRFPRVQEMLDVGHVSSS